jgi:hypothetical protein
MTEYSYLVVYLPRSTSRDAARRILAGHAEHGDWELTRLRLYPDGSRKATLRRQIIRAVRTPRCARPAKSGKVPRSGGSAAVQEAVEHPHAEFQ